MRTPRTRWLRCPTVPGEQFVVMGQPERSEFTESEPEELEADGQAARSKPSRHRDGRHSRLRGDRGIHRERAAPWVMCVLSSLSPAARVEAAAQRRGYAAAGKAGGVQKGRVLSHGALLRVVGRWRD